MRLLRLLLVAPKGSGGCGRGRLHDVVRGGTVAVTRGRTRRPACGVEVAGGPLGEDSGGVRGVVLAGEHVVRAVERDEGFGVACMLVDVAGVVDADDLVLG